MAPDELVLFDDQLTQRFARCFLCTETLAWVKVLYERSIGLCRHCHTRDRWGEVEQTLAERARQGA